MLTLHKDSHLDHSLTQMQIDWLLAQFADKNEFFITTLSLPAELGQIPCSLYGPLVGDPPIPESDVVYQARGERAYHSRCIHLPPRPTNKVSVIAGGHDGQPCVLYTAFGGPVSPQEPGDPGCKDVEVSKKFWAEHALAIS